MSHSNHSNRTCTCKLHPWNLSTNTAAEYGDLGAISHRVASAQDNKGMSKTSEPLHLAAQHGHISVTSYLLQNGFHADSGSTDPILKPKTSTPLHRACFSGAIGCVKLLLDYNANLLARDDSFGDGMTPLHKAVKGGRYHAVALIIQHCKLVDMLKVALQAKDSSKMTPLELALDLQLKGEEEILSLRRWDSVAGGPANLVKCAELLKNAACSLTDHVPIIRLGNHVEACSFAPVRMEFRSTPMPFCVNCEDADGGNCATALWEKSFTDAILKSTETVLSAVGFATNGDKTTGVLEEKSNSLLADGGIVGNRGPESGNKQLFDKIVGKPCFLCRTVTLAVFRSRQGNLVCKKCLRRSRVGYLAR